MPGTIELRLLPGPEFDNDEFETFLDQVRDRVGLVFDKLIDQYFGNKLRPIRFGARLFLGYKKDDVVEFVKREVRKNLLGRLLIRY